MGYPEMGYPEMGYPEYREPPPPYFTAQRPPTQEPPPVHVMTQPSAPQAVSLVAGQLQQTTPVVIGLQPPVIVGCALGPHSTTRQCPLCHATITTRVEHTNTIKNHLSALLLCLIGCYLCCLIPYCVNTCKNTNHYCPSCGSFLGTYYR